MELFFDPALSGHNALVTWINDATPDLLDWAVVFLSSTTKTYTWADCPGCSLGGKVALNDGIKAPVKVKLSKAMTVS